MESTAGKALAMNSATTLDTGVSIESPDEHCRVDDALEVATLLRRLVEGDVPVNLSAAGGVRYTTALWAEDAVGGLLVFSVDAGDPRVPPLLSAGRGAAVANLDNIELRFEVHDLKLVRGRDSCALHARYPAEVYRYQRRDSFRVQPLDYSQPVVRFDHPAVAGLPLSLPVVDISNGGLALRLPDDVPALERSDPFDAVLDLDGTATVHMGLRVVRFDVHQRVLGCEILQVAAQDARALQRYIDHTQRRRRMLVL